MRALLILLTALASLALAGCSSRAGSTRDSASESSGIQTRAYDQAPATQAPNTSSKPLSETNAPDAVAARQAQALASGKAVPNAGYRQPPQTSAQSPRAPPAGPIRGEPAAPHAQIAGFEKGRKALVRPGAALRSRPSSGSDAIQSLVLDTQVMLDSRVYNAEGYWWFAQAGAEDGWIAQGDLLQP